MRKNRRAGTYQNLASREGHCFARDIRVANHAFRIGVVFFLDRQAADGELKAVLDRAEIGPQHVDALKGDVHNANGRDRNVHLRYRQTTDTQVRSARTLAVNRYGLPLLRASLQRQRLRGTERTNPVEFGVERNRVNVLQQLGNFRIERLPIEVAVRAVGRLQGEFPNTLKNIRGFDQRTFRGLHHADAVLGVALGYVTASNERPESFRDCETGSVVGCAVDAQTARQSFEGFVEFAGAFPQQARGVDRRDVRVNSQTHGVFLRDWATFASLHRLKS